ncbi:MAG: DUF1254 domain-containing protein [Halieaceae bacterium]|jgi:hypothetical protein|nr:DUF1254 domain-containing protein [Halieaceae bacterium]MBT5005758.1 DUF1254 domain-containing protein [Halieaceae bacterium]MBT6126214.1 DUF1254 domain-containing protein [Halieaceae bacterium]MBT7720825.1 DUF1254 domain-containing protein [Halieaceae bacterium]
MFALNPNTFLQRCIRSSAMLVLGGALMAAQQTVLADDHCPAPALSVKAGPTTSVSEQNYSLAETQVIFADYVRKIAATTCSGGVGQLMHLRNTPDPTDRTILRINFDTIYSFLILDLTTPAIITLPETDGRYQSAEVLDEEHYIPFIFQRPGTYELTQENVGGQYAIVIFRTQVTMGDEEDLKAVHALQDQIQVAQEVPGSYVASDAWDMDDILAMRKAYQARAVRDKVPSEDMAGARGEITQDMHNFGPAVGWGGQTKEGAIYLFIDDEPNAPQTLLVKDVPMANNAFWSITVYDKDGYPQGEHFSLNSTFATANDEGETVVHFGGSPDQENYLEVYQGWNATFRIYSPQSEYFDGSWGIPSLLPVGN